MGSETGGCGGGVAEAVGVCVGCTARGYRELTCLRDFSTADCQLCLVGHLHLSGLMRNRRKE